MTWQVLIFISIFFASLSTILQRILLKEDKSDPIVYSIFFEILTGSIIGLVGWLLGGMKIPNIRPLLLNLSLTAFLYGFGNIFLFKALKYSEASIVTIIFSSRALFTIIASTLFLTEILSFYQFLGATFILGGVILVTQKSFKFSFRKGELLAFLAAACFGVAVTNDRFLLNSFKVYPYVFLAFILPAVLTAGIYSKNIGKMKVFLERKILVKMILLCVVYALAAITFYTALQIGTNSSQVASINQLTTIVTVLLAIVLLGEKENLFKKILGGVLGLIGLILVS